MPLYGFVSPGYPTRIAQKLRLYSYTHRNSVLWRTQGLRRDCQAKPGCQAKPDYQTKSELHQVLARNCSHISIQLSLNLLEWLNWAWLKQKPAGAMWCCWFEWLHLPASEERGSLNSAVNWQVQGSHSADFLIGRKRQKLLSVWKWLGMFGSAAILMT